MPVDRSLVPREYGAYAELGFPLATGFLAGGWSAAGAAFAVAVVAGFLLSEPIAVLAGARGPRARREESARARVRGFTLLGVAAVAGGLAMLLAPPVARLGALLPAALAVGLVPALARGRHKSLGGELLVAAALAAMVLPVGLAGGMARSPALLAFGIWLATFWLATLTVHAIKTRFKPALGQPWTVWAAPAFVVAVVAIAALGVMAGRVRFPFALAAVPAALVGGVALAAGVTPRHLRRVGWSLVAANLATFGLLVLA
jgi:hypothetical protein